jgi:folate-binding protein YgfZ
VLAALEGAGWCKERIEVVSVSGGGASNFLHGQLSQSVTDLPVGMARWSLLLEPDGKLGWLVVLAREAEQRFVLAGPRAAAGAIQARLDRFKLRVDAELALEPRWLLSSARAEDRADGLALVGDAGGDPVLTLRICQEEPTLDPDSECPAALARDLATWCGLITCEDLAIGANPFEGGRQLVERAVSFTKGCYTGQELVARIDARSGSAPRLLCGFQAPALVNAGAVITRDGADVGRVERGVQDPSRLLTRGLASLQRRALAASDAPLNVEGVVVEISGLEDLDPGA